jgi:ribonucleoside-triphosphate reductase (thioredoxin)
MAQKTTTSTATALLPVRAGGFASRRDPAVQADPAQCYNPGLHMFAAARELSGEPRERDDEFYYLSFRLRDSFILPYSTRSVRWGFPIGGGNTLGEINWYSKYSRVKLDGHKERFWEGIRRVVEGMYSIQKDHAQRYMLPWNEETAHTSAQECYERLFAGKWSPPGRGLWMMGTYFVNGLRDSSALQNCGFLSTVRLGEPGFDPAFPFHRLMEMSMLGVGVGFDTMGAGQLTLCQPIDNSDDPIVIDDSREGWIESVAMLLRTYFLPEQRAVRFNYEEIRPLGAPIKGFGGRAAGPDPLIQLHVRLCRLFNYRKGEPLTSTDIVDVMNMVGKCVVAANVRSSAEIALGSPDDEDFLDLKDAMVNPERMGYERGAEGGPLVRDGRWVEMAGGGWGFVSNNSILARVGMDYGPPARRTGINGEPGYVWLDNCRGYGRMADPRNDRDRRVMGVNPCGEQPLEDNELCTLVETFPTNCRTKADFLRTLKFAYLYGKTVTMLMTHWAETNEVMIRNRRIGTSMSGLAEFVEKEGWAELREWQDEGYKVIRRWDEIYSEWLGVRESIKVTTIKPSGTVSLLFGVTPGAHWPVARSHYLRRLRFTVTELIAEAMREAGYIVEPNVQNPTVGVVVTCPTLGPDIRAEREVPLWQKVALGSHCQEWWCDNAVSLTATFRPEEADEIGEVLRVNDSRLKSISFLPLGDDFSETPFPQMPYETVPREDWDALVAQVRPLDWEMLYAQPVAPEGEAYCTTDVCEMPAR